MIRQASGMEEGQCSNGGVCIMTDQQLETLRKQIAVYSYICDRLNHLHDSISSHHGRRLGNPYGGVYNTTSLTVGLGGHSKISSRQRWAPKPEQLQVLENIFERSNSTPSRNKIKEITVQLAQHGPISETNVYNWFQNRRARFKRKHSCLAPAAAPARDNLQAKMESPVVESAAAAAEEKSTKTEEDNDQDCDGAASPLLVDQIYIHTPEIGMDQLIGKLESPLSFNHYSQVEQHDIFG